MYEMEKYLEKECRDLNWTVVRVPALHSMPPTVKEFTTYEGFFVPDGKGLPAANGIYRGDVARYLLSQLSSDEWTRKAVAMCVL